MSAGLPLPKRLIVHGHWTMSGNKMSKSLGNVIHPRDAIAEYGEGLRYFLLRVGRLDADGDFGRDRIVKTINGELVNQLGNLISRAFNNKLFSKETIRGDTIDGELVGKVRKISLESAAYFDDHNFSVGLEKLLIILQDANRTFSENKPWEMIKAGEWEKVGRLISEVAHSLVVFSIMAQPVIPHSSSRILEMMGIPTNSRFFSDIFNFDGRSLKPLIKKIEPMFPRLDKT